MPSLAQKWLEQGKQIGLQQGVQMGLEQGLILEGQEMVLDLLAIRFMAIPLRLEKAIKQIFDRNVLKKLHRIILGVKDLSEFEQQMQKLTKNNYDM